MPENQDKSVTGAENGPALNQDAVAGESGNPSAPAPPVAKETQAGGLPLRARRAGTAASPMTDKSLDAQEGSKLGAASVAAAEPAPRAGAQPAGRRGTRREKGGRRAPRRWSAVVAGVATAGLAVAAVGSGSLFPGVDATAVPDPVPHVLPVGETMANCQGPTQLLAGSAAGADPEFSANSSSTTTSVNAAVLSGPGGDMPGSDLQALDGKSSPLTTLVKPPATPSATPTELTGAPKAKAHVLRGMNVNGPSVLRMDPLDGESSQGSGSVVVQAKDGDLAGLAAASCQTPGNELWLTGASTTVGRTAVLVLGNSSQSPATVSLELFGSGGPVQAAGGKGLVVAPGSSRSLVLAGLAPEQEMLSVKVKSVGGPVSAVIQQSVLRGLTPGGIDFLAPVQAPATSTTIPGVQVRAADAAAKITAQKDHSDAATVLAVTVPGMGDAVLEVKAFGADGQVALPNGGVFTAAAGKVSTFSLAGLPEGSYSLAVSSDAPVAAAVQLINFTKEGAAIDLAYAPSAARLDASHVLTLPEGVKSSLVFAAVDGSATIALVPVSASGVLGEAKNVELRAGSSVSVDPAKLLGSGAAAVVVSASGAPAFGSQLLVQNGTADIAVLPIGSATSGTQAINITTRY